MDSYNYEDLKKRIKEDVKLAKKQYELSSLKDSAKYFFGTTSCLVANQLIYQQFLNNNSLYLGLSMSSILYILLQQLSVMELKKKDYVYDNCVYKELIEDYNTLIDKYIEMLDKLKKTHVVDIQSTTEIMLKYGYFSPNHQYQHVFDFSNSYLDNPRFSYGVLIFQGFGIDCHNSNFLNEVLNKMGFNSKDAYVNDCSNSENPYIYYPYFDSENKKKSSLYKIRNFDYMINACEFNNNSYFFDITEGCYYAKRGKKLHKYGNRDMKLDVFFTEGRILSQKCFPTSNGLKQIFKYKTLRKSEIYSLYNEYLEKNINENLKYFDEFYEENKETYKKMKQKIQLLKDTIKV